MFGCVDIQRITVTLQTAESVNLEQITIYPPTAFRRPIKESAYREWQGLDRLLLQFWESRSVRPQIRFRKGNDGFDWKDLIPRLLPELTSRGIVDLVEN